jgi:DNA-directed RNA polymerase subunit RPC12/RpoP
MSVLGQNLVLERCPHCGTDLPTLTLIWQGQTVDYQNQHQRMWATYRCARCGGVVLASAPQVGQMVSAVYPSTGQLEPDIPSPARNYLQQAIDSRHAPAGSVMLAASAVDAMLKANGYKDGSLYSRIDKAVKEHLLTDGMGKWAHQVRLDANEPRHADSAAPLPASEDANRAVEFARALAMFLFVIPARVTRGIEESKPKA